MISIGSAMRFAGCICLFFGAAFSASASDFIPLGGVIKDAPSLVSLDINSRIYAVFARGSDDRLWWRAYGEAGRGFLHDNWAPVGNGTIIGPPSCLRTDGLQSAASVRIQCYARGKDSAVWRITMSNGQVTEDWTSLGGVVLSGPTAVMDSVVQHGYGTITPVRLYAAGSDFELWAYAGAVGLLSKEPKYDHWQKIPNAGDKLNGAPGCFADAWNPAVCLVPNKDGSTFVMPFSENLDNPAAPENHAKAKFILNLGAGASLVTSVNTAAALFFRGGDLTLTMRRLDRDHTSHSDGTTGNYTYKVGPPSSFGGQLASSPSCVSSSDIVTPYVPPLQPVVLSATWRAACAVQGTDKAVWLTMFELPR